MRFQDAENYLFKLYTAGLMHTTFLSGAPGVGKTACGKSLAYRLAEHYGQQMVDLSSSPNNNLADNQFGFRAIQMTVVDPLDFGGVVGIFDRGDGSGPYAARMKLEDLIPQEGRGIIIYDDLPTAPPLTQAAAYRTIWERDLIGPGWMIVATGNRAQDRAAVNRMPTPLVSKMGWIEFEANVTEWLNYMAGTGGDSRVRAFLQNAPNRFITFDPNIPGPFATARTWEALSDVCKVYGQDVPPIEAIKGWVGEGVADEFEQFANMAASLVDPDEVLLNPTRAPIPDDPGALYMVTTALADKATASNFDRIVTYLGRLPQVDYAIYCVKAALAVEAGRIKAMGTTEGAKYRSIQRTQVFIDFAVKHQDLLI